FAVPQALQVIIRPPPYSPSRRRQTACGTVEARAGRRPGIGPPSRAPPPEVSPWLAVRPPTVESRRSLPGQPRAWPDESVRPLIQAEPALGRVARLEGSNPVEVIGRDQPLENVGREAVADRDRRDELLELLADLIDVHRLVGVREQDA